MVKCLGSLSEALGHEGDHGLVAFGQPFVAAGAASAVDDPGQGALDDPRLRRISKACGIALADDLQPDLQAGAPGG